MRCSSVAIFCSSSCRSTSAACAALAAFSVMSSVAGLIGHDLDAALPERRHAGRRRSRRRTCPTGSAANA